MDKLSHMQEQAYQFDGRTRLFAIAWIGKMKKLGRREDFKDELDSREETENATTSTHEHFGLISIAARISENKNARVILLTDPGKNTNDRLKVEA